MTGSLFPDADPLTNAAEPDSSAPLADRMRPSRLSQMLGQDHLLGPGCVLSRLIDSGHLPSMILWGPPGVGKTTLARLMAQESKVRFVSLSAVLSGVKEVRRLIEEARRFRGAGALPTLLFIDEIHRFNKAQQDAFLPHVENGTITLVGATTENPSFEVIAPLLSRCRVFVLRSLSREDLTAVMSQALQDEERGLGKLGVEVQEGVLERLADFADGDARQALNSLEVAARLAVTKSSDIPSITLDLLKTALQKRHLLYDKAGEEHYNLISALHKSLRNSDVDASIYWLARMLEAGEDPGYLLRRMIRFAAEDIGVADRGAVGRAVAAAQAFDRVGLPEGKLFLAQLAVDLAQAPKSNAVYRAYSEAVKDVEKSRNQPVPLHLRNAPTSLMTELGYGEGYRNVHDIGKEEAEAMACLPEELKKRRYFEE